MTFATGEGHRTWYFVRDLTVLQGGWARCNAATLKLFSPSTRAIRGTRYKVRRGKLTYAPAATCKARYSRCWSPRRRRSSRSKPPIGYRF